jgi:hypothetical protein
VRDSKEILRGRNGEGEMSLTLSIPSIISVKNTLIPENYPDYLILVGFDL